MKLLLRYGGNPQQSNRKGETPLKVANSPTMVNLLLGKGTYTSSEESSTGKPGRQTMWVGGRGSVLPVGGAPCSIYIWYSPADYYRVYKVTCTFRNFQIQEFSRVPHCQDVCTLLRCQPCVLQIPVGSFCLWLASDVTKVKCFFRSKTSQSPLLGGLFPSQLQSILSWC